MLHKEVKTRREQLAGKQSGSSFPHLWFHIGFSELQSHFSLGKDLKIHEGADLRATVPYHGEKSVVTSQSPWVY